MEYLSLQVRQAIRKSFSPAFIYPYQRTLILTQGGSKLERARDLFEQALEKCPAQSCKPIFLMYAQLEEEHGLAKRAMSIYDRATQVVENGDKFEVGAYP
jgi:pre-mRNA-splicing factor SYF1